MAEEHGSPGADEIEVVVAVGVVEILAEAAFDDEWLAADGAESADGRIDAADEDFFGSAKISRERRLQRVLVWGAVMAFVSLDTFRLKPREIGISFHDGARSRRHRSRREPDRDIVARVWAERVEPRLSKSTRQSTCRHKTSTGAPTKRSREII